MAPLSADIVHRLRFKVAGNTCSGQLSSDKSSVKYSVSRIHIQPFFPFQNGSLGKCKESFFVLHNPKESGPGSCINNSVFLYRQFPLTLISKKRTVVQNIDLRPIPAPLKKLAKIYQLRRVSHLKEWVIF